MKATRILKATKEKCQVTYKADFSRETLNARRTYNNVFQVLKKN
jgi:hypothetical protein